jgi:outer membrane lipoprotein-sorting protein
VISFRTMWILLLALAQGADPDAETALRRLSDRFRDAKTIRARVVQVRRSELLDEPITSSGVLYFRREPPRMVFRMAEPRRTEIHLDRQAYQVYRPDESRLEVFEFESDMLSGRLLTVFDPKPDELVKSFRMRSAPAGEDALEVSLDPLDEKVRGHLKRLVLTVARKDGELRRIDTVDADGDQIRFDLSEIRPDAEIPREVFELQVPAGTRVLRHKAKLGK